MEDGILFAPRALRRARRLLLPAHHAHGAGARDQGAGRGQLRSADRSAARSISSRAPSPPTKRARSISRSAATATASCTASSAPARRAPGYVIEGVHLRSTGFKQIDGGGDTGFDKNEWMWKGRYLLSTDPQRVPERGPEARLLRRGFARELPRPQRRRPSRQPVPALRGQPPRSHAVAPHADRRHLPRASFARGVHDRRRRLPQRLLRTWRKFNRIGPNGAVSSVLANPTGGEPDAYSVLTGESDTSTTAGDGAATDDLHRPEPARVRLPGRAGGRRLAGTVRRLSNTGSKPASATTTTASTRLHTEDGFLMRERRSSCATDESTHHHGEQSRTGRNALALHVTDAATWGPLTVTPGVRVELIDTWARDRLDGLRGTRAFAAGLHPRARCLRRADADARSSRRRLPRFLARRAAEGGDIEA